MKKVSIYYKGVSLVTASVDFILFKVTSKFSKNLTEKVHEVVKIIY